MPYLLLLKSPFAVDITRIRCGLVFVSFCVVGRIPLFDKFKFLTAKNFMAPDLLFSRARCDAMSRARYEAIWLQTHYSRILLQVQLVIVECRFVAQCSDPLFELLYNIKLYVAMYLT